MLCSVLHQQATLWPVIDADPVNSNVNCCLVTGCNNVTCNKPCNVTSLNSTATSYYEYHTSPDDHDVNVIRITFYYRGLDAGPCADVPLSCSSHDACTSGVVGNDNIIGISVIGLANSKSMIIICFL